MNRIITVIVISASSFLASCSSETESLLKKFDSFIYSVQEHQDDYNGKQWEKMDDRLVLLVDEYKALKREMTDEQRNHVDLIIGKYTGIRVNAQTNGLLEELGSGLKQFEGFVEEVTSD